MTAQVKKPARKTKLDIEDAIALRKAGKSYRDIAKTLDVSKDTVHQQIRNLVPNEQTEYYKTHRADILAELQRNILHSIDSEDIKKSPFGSRVLAYAQLYDKERIERGGGSQVKPLVIINRISIGKVEQNNSNNVQANISSNTIIDIESV